MSSQHHHISKVTFDLRLAALEDAFSLQQQVSACFHDQVSRQLSDLFDELVPSAEHVYIDKLELEIGNISSAELENGTLTRRILQSLREQIRIMGTQADIPGNYQKLSLPAHAFQQWMSFLTTGQLLKPLDKAEVEWEEHILEALVKNITYPEELRLLLARSRWARERLVAQYRDSFLIKLLQVYSGHRMEGLSEGYRRQFAQMREESSGTLGGGALEHDDPVKGRKPRVMTLEQYRQIFWFFVTKQVILKGQATPSSNLLKEFNEFLRNHEPVEMEGHPDSMEGGEKIITENESAATVGEVSEYPDRENPSEWYLDQAGVILLHPFLGQFFDRLGLLENNAFQDEGGRNNALHLLHYLATGLSEPPEYQLLLAKIVCGVPINWPVNRLVALSEEWLDEAEHLLDVVVNRWEVLGEVSPDALREGFLNRPGKLSKKNGKWRLQVEHRAIDVLLDRLPWGISLVKTPWMEEIMTVEWR